jgi:hypothetical protein
MACRIDTPLHAESVPAASSALDPVPYGPSDEGEMILGTLEVQGARKSDRGLGDEPRLRFGVRPTGGVHKKRVTQEDVSDLTGSQVHGSGQIRQWDLRTLSGEGSGQSCFAGRT